MKFYHQNLLKTVWICSAVAAIVIGSGWVFIPAFIITIRCLND